MSYRSVEVEVTHKQAKWFEKHALKEPQKPLQVQVNDKTAVFGGTTFDLRPLGDDFTAVFKPGRTVPLGEFSADTIRHTVSDEAAKYVRVLRAAKLDETYNAPVAFELPDGELVHPGACYRRLPYCVVKKHVYVRHEDDRCAACGEAFE